jgi:4-amino-4-deoxy-L-arabinose transferase-like glycosyltransferase
VTPLSRPRLLRYGLGLALLTAVTRLPLLAHPFPVDDERVYSVVANAMHSGGKPYLDAVERKPPLLFWTYAAIVGVTGPYHWLGLHSAALLWLLLTLAGCYRVGSALFDRNTGLAAALLYSIYQPWWAPGTLALNGEVLMNLPLMWAAWLVLRPSHSKLRPELFGAGLLLCAAFLLKQPAAIAALPFGIYLLLPSYRQSRGLSAANAWLQASLLTAGFLAALGGVVLVLRAQGLLGEALYWSIGDHADPYFAWLKGIGLAVGFLAICAPLTIAAYRSLQPTRGPATGDPWAGRMAERSAVLLWVGVSGLGVAAGGRFYGHYFIQLVAPLAVLAAPWVARTLTAPGRPRRALAGYLAASAVALLAWHAIGLPPSRSPSAAGLYVRAHSDPGDRLFVWGQATPIYLDAERLPASRYIATFPLTGYIFGSPHSWDPAYDTSDRILPGAWQHLREDFARHPPRYIIDTDAARAVARYPVANFPVLRDLLAAHYRVVQHALDGVVYERTDPVLAPRP